VVAAFVKARNHLNPMKNRLSLAALVVASLSATALVSPAHNLDTRATSISFAQDYIQTMSTRAGLSQPMVQVNDTFWVVIKTTPGPGTPTGVGGYQTFYVPDGMQVVDVAYVRPVATGVDSRGFVSIPMKGQSAIAIGDGSIGAKVATGLNPDGTGISLGPNILGVTEKTVTDAGLARGTISGVYADTGIFYSIDERTEFNSYGAAPAGGSSSMTNNSGDKVGEYYAENTPATSPGILGVMTKWDSYQLRAFGRKDVAAIIDPLDERGNAPWGMASAVAGPQCGYAWSFNYDNYTGTGSIPSCIEVGPWNRIKYPGSQVSKDQAGLISTTIGYTGIDASGMGVDTTAVPGGTNAIRFAIGQLEFGRSEHSAVKVKVLTLPSVNCSPIYGDAFGGDAGGTSNGKDHIWRYFDPTVVSLKPCTLLQKVASNPHIAPGATTSFKITFANLGSVALPNVVLSDPIPAGLTYLSAVPAPDTISGTTLTWNVGTVAPNQIVNLTINVKGTGSGSILNEVTAKSNGSTIAIADETVDIGLYALLREDKTVDTDPATAGDQNTATPGQNVTYTITVSNDGPGPNGVPLVVTDLLPAGFSYSIPGPVTATVNGATVTPVISYSNPNQPTFTLSQAIAAGKTAVIKFVVTVGPGVAAGTYYNGVDLAFEGKKVGPHPEAPVIVGGGQIGDTVYTDTNGSGSQDPGEPGIPGVTVTLYNDVNNNDIWDTGDTSAGSKVTDSNGNYLFGGLSAGEYVVKINSPPSGTNTGNPPGGTGNPGNEGAVTLPLNGSVLTLDFGYQSTTTGSIGDQVYYDVNANGTYNAGTDSPLPNVTVTLYASDGTTVLATTTSDSNGLYTFAGRPAGNYVVKVDLTDPDISSSLVSSVSGGAYSAFSLGAGQALTDKDFPFVFTYLDKTVDKATAVAGDLLTFTLRPYFPGPSLLTNATVTDAVPAGTTFGSFIQSGAVSNVPPPTWTLGTNSAAVNGSHTGTTGSGTVNASASADSWLDGDHKTTNHGTSATMTFDPSGGSSMGNGRPVMEFDLSGIPSGATITGATLKLTVTAVGGTADTRTIDVRALTKDWVETQVTWNRASTATAWTAAGGDFGAVLATTTGLFNTIGGQYSWTSASLITQVRNWYATPSSNYGLIIGDSTTGTNTRDFATKENATAGYRPVLEITYTGGPSTPTTSTVLAVDKRLVTDPDPSSGTTGVNVVVTMTVGSDTALTGVVPPALAVNKSLGTAATATLISGTPPNVNIAAGGSATFTWTYRLDVAAAVGSWKENLTFSCAQFASAGATFGAATSPSVILTQPLKFTATVNTNPGVSTVTNTGHLYNNNGATLLQNSPTTTTTLHGSIGDSVWWDADVDGVQDSGELPIAGAAVLLYVDADNNGILDVAGGDYQVAFALTGADGKYLINNLPAGKYLVDVYEDSIDVGGGTEPVPTTPNVQFKSLAGGENYLAADFGYFQGARVEGNVFWDANRDAFFGAGETGLTPVHVFLNGFDMFGTPVTATALTDSSGHFVFIVPEGNYTLTYSDADVQAINASLDDTTTPTSYTFHAYPGEDWHPVFNFGVDNNGRIGDTLFADADGNGSQGSGEAGLAGVTVELYFDVNNNNQVDAGDTLLESQATNTNGNYLFVGLADGNYAVKVLTATLPLGYNTAPTAKPSTEWVAGSEAGATVTSGSWVLDRDFGYKLIPNTYTVSGNIWNDADGSGSKNGVEGDMTGVTVTISVDADGAGGNPPVIYTVTTDISGNYSLSGVPGSAGVVITVDIATLPSSSTGYLNTGDPDGVMNSTTTFTMANANRPNQNFGYLETGAIAGTVRADTTGDYLYTGPPDTLLAVVTLTLKNSAGGDIDSDPIAPGIQPTTTTTLFNGTYSFGALPPGSYQVWETQPAGYASVSDVDGGSPDRIGDVSLITVASGVTNSGNDFLEFLQACPDTWAAWRAKWGVGEEAYHENPDGDRYDNLDEYAFCMPPNSGAFKPFCLFPESDFARMYGLFRRTAGSTTDVTYTLERSAALGNPTDWTALLSIPLTDSNTTVINNGNGTEIVRINDLETFTGLTDPATGLTEGFVRIRVDLDKDGDHVIDATSYTEVLGWTETALGTTTPDVVCCQTYNNPYLHCSSFTGTVDVTNGVSGQTLGFVNSVGPNPPWDLANLLPPVAGALPAFYYYCLEVSLGDNPGQRFDVASVTANTLTVASDTDLCAGTPPFNTLIVDPAPIPPATSLPASLAGDAVVVRRHWTLGELFPVSRFVASADAASADQVQTYTPGLAPWTTYWLKNTTPATWVELGGDGTNKAATVIAPGQGLFVLKRSTPTTLLAYGEVRNNDFIRPLCIDLNLVGGGYPLDQSATGVGTRQMNLTAQPNLPVVFYGSRDFSTADSFFLWQGDASPGANSYDSFFLLNGAPTQPSWIKWVKVGDKNLTSQDAVKFFLGDRAAFLRVKYDLHTYRIPTPWSP
jgi:uncharacterized repeat protein (TIGR01451 family)